MQGVGVPGTVINRYCWIMSTFTLPKHFEGEIGEDFIHHGVGEQYKHTTISYGPGHTRHVATSLDGFIS